MTSQHGQSLPEESARPASPLPARITSWAPWLVVGCYVLGAFALTWGLWADPAGQMVAGNSGDINLFAWFMRDIGGDFIEPEQTGQATSYIYNRLSTAVYLTNLWQGTLSGRAPSQSQIRKDLAYWQLAAIVTVAGRNSRLARFLTGEFGRPAVQVDDVLAWRIPPGRASAR